MPHKYKNSGYTIVNFSKKDLSKIIREFERFEKLPYEKKRPKHDPNDSYFYLARELENCMMRSDALSCHSYGVYTEMTAPSSNICSTDKDKSKRIIVHETLSQSCSANKDESNRSIANKHLLHNYSVDVYELCSTEEDKSECTITEQQDAKKWGYIWCALQF